MTIHAEITPYVHTAKRCAVMTTAATASDAGMSGLSQRCSPADIATAAARLRLTHTTARAVTVALITLRIGHASIATVRASVRAGTSS